MAADNCIAHYVLNFDWSTALLLGAILVVTGPTVIGPLLRQIRPTGRVGPIARWEGIVIDPIGAVLAVLVFEAIGAAHQAGLEQATWAATTGLLKTVAAGGGTGAITAFALAALLRRHIIPDHLESSVTLMAVLGVFTASNLLQHESGLVSVTVMGVLLANRPNLDLHHIKEFQETLSLLLISTLFILLSARVNLQDLTSMGWRGLLFLAAMLLIVRPVAVWLSSLRSDLTWREKTFLSWFAPRGIVAAAVSSVFTLQMGDAGSGLVTATFLVIVGTVVIYGFTAFPLARWLNLAEANPQGVLIAGAHAGARAIAHALQESGFPVLLVDTNRWNIQAARMEGLPTRHGNILTEELLDRLNLGGIGRFIALTPNDEVNALAALHLRGLFGRAEVYQLPPRQRTERSETRPESVRTRFLFGPEVTPRYLDERFARGAVIKTNAPEPGVRLRRLSGEVRPVDDNSPVHRDRIGTAASLRHQGEGRSQGGPVDHRTDRTTARQ